MSPAAWTFAPSAMCASTAPTIELMAIEPAPVDVAPAASEPGGDADDGRRRVGVERDVALRLDLGILGVGGDRVLDQVISDRDPDRRPADRQADPPAAPTMLEVSLASTRIGPPAMMPVIMAGFAALMISAWTTSWMIRLTDAEPAAAKPSPPPPATPDRDAQDARLRKGRHAHPARDVDTSSYRSQPETVPSISL